MMRKVIKYNLCNPQDVDEYLSKGWELYGNPIVVIDMVQQIEDGNTCNPVFEVHNKGWQPIVQYIDDEKV